MPYGGGPKSGCMARERPMKSMYALDRGSTGALLMFWFHQLSDGNSRRLPKSSFSWTTVEDSPGGGVGDGTGDGDSCSDGLAGLPAQPSAIVTSANAVHRRRTTLGKWQETVQS